ncbi:MAG: hypothetical protein H7061_00575 [Bdellovibrionaceae bacterium]|nr:hypothetical protein [Bdellovibrio sp.]
MNSTRIALSALALTFTFSFAQANMKENNAAIMDACKDDIAATHCEGKKVGKGLMKCMHAYHKSNKDYKMTASCEATTKKMHDKRKANKEEKSP